MLTPQDNVDANGNSYLLCAPPDSSICAIQVMRAKHVGNGGDNFVFALMGWDPIFYASLTKESTQVHV